MMWCPIRPALSSNVPHDGRGHGRSLKSRMAARHAAIRAPFPPCRLEGNPHDGNPPRRMDGSEGGFLQTRRKVGEGGRYSRSIGPDGTGRQGHEAGTLAYIRPAARSVRQRTVRLDVAEGALHDTFHDDPVGSQRDKARYRRGEPWRAARRLSQRLRSLF
jgi:hypothetical protein